MRARVRCQNQLWLCIPRCAFAEASGLAVSANQPPSQVSVPLCPCSHATSMNQTYSINLQV